MPVSPQALTKSFYFPLSIVYSNKIKSINMYNFFLQLHSGFRFIVMILILLAILQSLAGWFGNRPYTNTNRKINLFTLISAHIQLLIGLVLYFLSPLVQFSSAAMKDNTTRYWTAEHIV